MSQKSPTPSVVVVATEVPGLTGGAPVRNYQLIRGLAKRGWRVTVLCLTPKAAEISAAAQRLEHELGVTAVVLAQPQLSPLAALVGTLRRRVPPYYLASRRSELSRRLQTIAAAERPDWIQFEELEAYYAAAPVIPALQAASSHIVLDAHNVEWRGFAEAVGSFSLPKQLMGRYITPFLRRFEHQAAAQANVVLACSQLDADYFQPIARQVAVIPNGVDCEAFTPATNQQPQDTAPRLLFMGGTSYPPNADALKWYLADIHPAVTTAVPSLRLTILGGRPPQWLQELAATDPTLELPGFVPDVKPYLTRADVCLCPIRAGSGTRLKVLEYLGAGKAIVTTTKGAEGIAYQDGTHLLVADTAPDFATAVTKLLRNPPLRTSLGQKARELAVAQYDWQAITDHLAETIVNAVRKEPQT